MTPCKGCGRQILFAKITKRDGTPGEVPLDPSAPVYQMAGGGEPSAQLVSKATRIYVSHFATCSKASQFSKGKR